MVAGGELRVVSVYHDEDCVYLVAVRVVVVLRVFDVGVHDAGGVVAALVGVFEMIPAVHASHAAFVAFGGERVAVVEFQGGGAYFVVADGDVGGVAAFEDCGVFFRRVVLVEGGFVGVHGWFFSLRLLVFMFACGDASVGAVSGCPSRSRGVCGPRAGAVVRGSTRSPSLWGGSRMLSRP